MSGRAEYLCYTDGSCKAGDDAPGGWGFVVKPPVGPSIEGYGSATRTRILSKRLVVRWQWVRAHNGNSGRRCARGAGRSRGQGRRATTLTSA